MEHDHCWEILVDGKGDDKSGFVQCVIKGCEEVKYLDSESMKQFKKLREQVDCGHEITLTEKGESNQNFWPEIIDAE